MAEWKFDEGVGTTAYDTSGNNLNGRLYNSPSWVLGKIGKAFDFNGSSSYVDAGTSPLFDITDEKTIEFWVKPGTQIGNWRRPLSFGGYAANGWTIYTGTTGVETLYPSLGTASGWSGSLAPAIPVVPGTWNHVAIVAKLGSYGRSYLNGISVGASITPATYYSNTAQSLKIGTEGGSYYDGSVDQVRIYNYARTPAQVAYDYNKGGPVGWWKMDECQGTQIADWSGNANHGILSIGASGTQNTVGTCSVGTSAAWTAGATGKINASLNFDGSDDYITMNDNFNMNTNDFSLATWIKPSGSGYRAIISKGDAGIGANKGYRLRLESNNTLLFTVTGNSEVGLTTANTLTSGNWYHVVVTKNSSTMKIFVNGVEWASANSPAGTVDNALYSYIGKQSTWYWNGFIDDTRIYNYALTATQVKTLFNNGAVNFR